MFSRQRIGILLMGMALAVLPAVAGAASTEDTSVSEGKLVKKYTPLAGSEENAKKLVTGLRNGTSFTLASPSGDVAFATPTRKMGVGNVNIALAMAEKQLAGNPNPTTADLHSALLNADNGVLTLRAQGMGWGEVAHTLGFKVGDVMRASPAKADAARSNGKDNRPASERVARGSGERPDIQRPAKAERPDTARVERPEKPQRPERGGR